MRIRVMKNAYVSEEIEKALIEKYQHNPLIDIYNIPLNYATAKGLLNPNSKSYKMLNEGHLVSMYETGGMTVNQTQALYKLRERFKFNFSGLVHSAGRIEDMFKSSGGQYGNAVVREAYMLGIVKSNREG